MPKWVVLALPAYLLLSGFGVADTITIDGSTYDRVYVRESDSRYYVQIPSTGQTLSAPKSSVEASDVSFTKDKADRDALLREWRIHSALGSVPAHKGTEEGLVSHGLSNVQSHEALREKWVSVEPQDDLHLMRSAPLETHGALAAPTTVRDQVQRTPSPLETGKVTDGYVQRCKLEDVKLREALDALLRPLNLDYEVHDGYIWISTAEKIRTESFEPMEMRTFQLNHAGTETLPKVGLSNLGGFGGTVSGRTGYGGGYTNSYQGEYNGVYRTR